MSEGDIEAIRRALALTAADEALVLEAAPLLVGEIARWVENFYARLTADPVAMPLLADEATVVRVKRSLVAWFQELLSLPLDAAYERTRSEIGRVHVRTGMPQHMMVTAMSSVRRDVHASVLRVLGGDRPRAEAVADVLERVLDLELALMLGAYRRRSRELAHRTDRHLLERRAESRAVRVRVDAADAASCYLALLRRAKEPEAVERWGSLLAQTLDAMARPWGKRSGEEPPLGEGPREVALAEVCARALAQVSQPARTEVETLVEPPEARVVVHETPLALALEELLQIAMNRDPGGSVRLTATALADGGLVLEVTDGGPRWPEGVRGVAEGVADAGVSPTAFAELAAELHGGRFELVRPPGGGGGMRLWLSPVATVPAEARPT